MKKNDRLKFGQVTRREINDLVNKQVHSFRDDLRQRCSCDKPSIYREVEQVARIFLELTQAVTELRVSGEFLEFRVKGWKVRVDSLIDQDRKIETDKTFCSTFGRYVLQAGTRILPAVAKIR